MKQRVLSPNTHGLSVIGLSINWWWCVITLLVFSLLIKLGLWQLDRAKQKEQRLTRIEALTSKQAISLEQLLLKVDKNDQATLNDMPVKVKGTFDNEVLLLLDNQPEQGKIGYRVFQLVSQGQYQFLVNLGWVPASVNRNELPSIKPIKDFHQFSGYIRFVEQGFLLQEQVFEQVKWPLRIQQIDVNKISKLVNKQLLPFVVYLDEKETIGYKKNWQPIVMLPEKHKGYAFQWLSLAVAWLCLMIWSARKANTANKSKPHNK